MGGMTGGGGSGNYYEAAAVGLVGGLAGLFGKPKKWTDNNVYASSKENREWYDQQQRGQFEDWYGSDPHAFWGGNDAWTTSGQGFDDPIYGGRSINDFLGGAGGGGRASAGHASGFAAHAGTAHAGHADASLIDMNDESMQILPSDRIREAALGTIREGTESATRGSINDLEQQYALTGDEQDSGGAAAIYMRQRIFDEQRKALAGGYRSFFTDWTNQAAGRRAGGLTTNAQLGTQTSIANAGFDTETSIANAGYQTQASIATAGNRTGASIANAGNRTQASIANAGMAESRANRMGQLGLGLMQLRGADEDRMLERYFGMMDRNQRERMPVPGSMTPERGAWGRFFTGSLQGYQTYQGKMQGSDYGSPTYGQY